MDFAGYVYANKQDQYFVRYEEFVPMLINVTQQIVKRIEKLEGQAR